ncbi:U7 snRNA-associated Sm-like protein LSm10 isoform X2 [Anoplolepis gracilipes]|uniref:U7 snRNA-associated Sm-like protein LSm10 isoform X2 n=1 Tax=Anoplolepis gracilipes TaxID=354296 RepID=UPI003B9E7620
MAVYSQREKHFLYNSLSILLKAVEKQRTTIDLRNEASIFGIVEQADAYMNVVMRDCVFTDPRGDSFKFDMFFVQARNIRCVHIPPNIRIIPAIKEQLKQLSGPSKEMKNVRYTFKEKRTQQRQQEGLAAVKQILENRDKTKSQSTK